MNLEKVLKKFAEMQEYAETKGTNANLWWYFFEAGKAYKLMEYATAIEKIEKIKEGNMERKQVTLKFANNKTDKLLDCKDKVEKSKIYYSVGFIATTCFKEKWYFPMTEFSETSIVGKYNHLKAYTETPTVELSKMEIIENYIGSRKVLLQDYFYCGFDNPRAVNINAFGELIF